MVDIHSHFLPGIDDGADSLETALAMIEMAAADGTTHLVGTPHCNARYSFSQEKNGVLLRALQARAGNRIVLMSGCDFHLSYENIQNLLADKMPYTLNQGDYLLAEFSDYGLAPNTLDILHKLRLGNLVPIITHPERNALLHEQGLRFFCRLVEMGCAVQVTAGSFTGRFGRLAKKFAERLLECGLVHFVASDAHDTQNRPPKLSPARAVVAERFGNEVAQALFVDNPRAAIESRPLPYCPEPTPPPERRRSFLFFWKR
jgi:protein-tyrosine phosphatase